ncbi:MAG: tetratricopeptide repeat protein [Bacteroidota bacterium]
MKNIFILTVLSLFCSLALAQDDLILQLKSDYELENYEQILQEHADSLDAYPAKAIYYVAIAYYMKGEDKKSLETMNLSIQKDASDPDAHFMKGMTLNYLGEFDPAILCFKQAIELDSSNTHYYSGLGDAYLNQEKYELALEAYIASTQRENPLDRPFSLIPQIYHSLHQSDKALEAAYFAKEHMSQSSDSYLLVLYNIGLFEYLNQQYDKSELALSELIEWVPDDFQAHAKLIQAYYGQQQYDKAEPHRKALYDAYEKGLLPDNLKEMFCFDQFQWEDKSIRVFERFEEKEGELYYKHLFYVLDEKGEIETRIQTENSPISVELGGPKYAIGMNTGASHSTFGFIQEDFEYENLKAIVIQILNKEIGAAASSTFSRANEGKKKKKKNKKKRKKKE